jgi:hypothetical protein
VPEIKAVVKKSNPFVTKSVIPEWRNAYKVLFGGSFAVFAASLNIFFQVNWKK